MPLAILAILGGLALVIGIVLGGRLSGARLLDGVASFGNSVSDFANSGVGLVGLGFLGGALIGWLSAVKWLRYRLRGRSLLLLDPRRADMSFVEGIDHVRAQSGSPKPEVDQAANSIVEAAARGRLSLWQRSGTNVLSRVTPRQIRKAGTRLAMVAGEMERERRPGGVEFRLFRNEVESLWPSRRQLTIAQQNADRPEWRMPAAAVADGLRRTAEKLIKLK